jgi:hypothetical protein
MILDAILKAIPITITASIMLCDVFKYAPHNDSKSFARSILYTKLTPIKIHIPSISVYGTDPKERDVGTRIK